MMCIDVVCFLVFLFSCVYSVPYTYSDWREGSGCFNEVNKYVKLKDYNVINGIRVSSLERCKQECDSSFLNCKSFSYKDKRFQYGRDDDEYEENCLLSRKSTERSNGGLTSMLFSRDFEDDDDYTFYERDTRSSCGNDFNSYYRDDRGRQNCFQQVGNGRPMPQRYIKHITHTRSMAECEDDCLSANFVCRGFNYRYIDRTYPYSQFMVKCELSTQDTHLYGISILDHDNDEYEFYERKEYGTTCDKTHGGSFGRNDDYYYKSNSNSFGNSFSNSDNNLLCFKIFQSYLRMSDSYVKDSSREPSLQKCTEKCRDARSFDCKSLAYSYQSDLFGSFRTHRMDNCLLSDEEARYIEDRRGGAIPEQSFDFYERDSKYDNDCRRNMNAGLHGSRDFIFPSSREVRHFSVEGYPCMRNEGCVMNFLGSYYECETKYHGMKFCCRLDSECQYRQRGSTTKTCYVGLDDNSKSWRPCVSRRSYLMESESDTKRRNDLEKESPRAIEVRNMTELGVKN